MSKILPLTQYAGESSTFWSHTLHSTSPLSRFNSNKHVPMHWDSLRSCKYYNRIIFHKRTQIKFNILPQNSTHPFIEHTLEMRAIRAVGGSFWEETLVEQHFINGLLHVWQVLTIVHVVKYTFTNSVITHWGYSAVMWYRCVESKSTTKCHVKWGRGRCVRTLQD